MSDQCPNCRSGDTIARRPYVQSVGHPLFDGRRLAECPACGLWFCDPMPSESSLSGYYAAGSYDQGEMREAETPWSFGAVRSRSQYSFVADALGRRPSSWLDIGAGYGTLLNEAARRGVERTAAVEPTPVRQTALAQAGHTIFSAVDAVSGKWDVISFSHVLEHVPDPHAFIDAARANLADDGLMFCEVPNVLLTKPSKDEPHVLFFTRASLLSTFERAGCQVRRIETAGRRHGLIWRVANWLRHGLPHRGVLPGDRLPDAMFRYASDGRVYLRCAASASV